MPEEYAAERLVWADACAVRVELTATRRQLLLDEPKATLQMLALSEESGAASEVPLILDRALEGAMALLGTDLGHVQIRQPASGALTIATGSGFGSEFLEYFAVVDDDGSAWGRAEQRRSQTVITEVNEDPGFALRREIAAASGFRAVHRRRSSMRQGACVG